MVVGRQRYDGGGGRPRKARPRSIKTKPAFKPHEFMRPTAPPMIDCSVLVVYAAQNDKWAHAGRVPWPSLRG